MRKIDTIVIAAGGKSERLAEYFESLNFRNTKILFPIKQGKPILGYLIETAIKNGYKKIFVLASFYDGEIKHFVERSYKNNNITIISGGEQGRKVGVTKTLSFIEKELAQPFIYSDGDILFEPNLLHKLSKFKFINNVLMNCVVSRKDMALTHSQFILKNGALTKINVRCEGLINKLNNAFCSLGLMVVNNKIFKQIPEYKNIGDLDLVVKRLYEINQRSIGFYLYKGKWLSIHEKEDIYRVASGYYNNLSLRNFNI